MYSRENVPEKLGSLILTAAYILLRSPSFPNHSLYLYYDYNMPIPVAARSKAYE
jgi:hypothetical protein